MVIAAVASIIVQNIPAFLWAVGGTLAFLGVGGVISGYISYSQGNSFWESFSTYVNQNIAQSMAISMVFLLATIGMSVIKNALITNKKSALSNAQNISKCFIKGTLVKTEEGDRAIEEIKVGDKVWAYDEKTGKKELKEVIQLFRNTTKQWTLVEIDGENGSETITCTPGHKFYLPENKNKRDLNEVHEHEGYEFLSEQWVSAQHLKIGDNVLLENGKYGIIKGVVTKDLETPETTYNFEVTDYHTYYVGEKGTLVHNADCGIRPTQKGIDNIKQHLSGLDPDYANNAMVSRLENALSNGSKIYGADKNFYMHELKEMKLMRSGMSYNAAHEASLNYYNVAREALYHPDVIMMHPETWNQRYIDYWGLKR